MTRFVLVRALTLALGLVLASLIIFITLRLLPGDVAQVIAGTQATPERVALLRAQLGLDQPLSRQYFDWIGGVLGGNIGTSIVTGTPIGSELVEKAQVTIPLTIGALVLGLLMAFPLGVLAALRHGYVSGRVVSGLGVVAAAVPAVWAGLLGIVVFSSWLGWLPAQGFPRDGWADPWLAIRALTLPIFTIGLIEGAVLFRFVRSATLDALQAEHVRTARSQGLTRVRALLAHGLPGVGLSIVSIIGVQVAGLLVGAVVIEQLFSLPGLGRMLVADVGNRDLVKVQSTLLVLTGVVLLIGALVDVAHRAIDPRLRSVAP